MAAAGKRNKKEWKSHLTYPEWLQINEKRVAPEARDWLFLTYLDTLDFTDHQTDGATTKRKEITYEENKQMRSWDEDFDP